MSTISEVNDETFSSSVLEADGVVLVEFWAPGCRPCTQVEPILEELARELDGRATVAKVDTDANPRTAEKYRIMSLPTILIFAGGEVVASMIGSRPKAAIRAALTEHVAA